MNLGRSSGKKIKFNLLVKKSKTFSAVNFFDMQEEKNFLLRRILGGHFFLKSFFFTKNNKDINRKKFNLYTLGETEGLLVKKELVRCIYRIFLKFFFCKLRKSLIFLIFLVF